MPAGTFTAQPDPQIKQVNSVHRPLYYRIEKQADVAASPVEIAQARVTITYNGSLLTNSLTGDTIELIIDNIEDLGSDLYAIEFSISQQLKDQLDPTSVLSLPAIFRSLDSVTSVVEDKSFALVSVTVNYYYFENVSGRLVLDIATGEDDTSDTCMVGNFLEQTLGQRGLAGPNLVWAGLVQSEYLLINGHVNVSGVDITGRTLSSRKKQYLFDTALRFLWPRYGAATATTVKRTAAQMARAMYLFTVDAQMTVRNNWTGNVLPQLWVMETTPIVFDGPPNYSSSGVFDIICASRNTVGNEWQEITQYSFRRSPGAGRFTDTILPVLKGTNVTRIDFFNDGFAGTIPNCFPDATTAQLPNLASGTLEGFSFASTPEQFTDVDHTFVERYSATGLGLNINNNNIVEADLDAIVDVIHAQYLATGFTGATFDLRLNTGSAATAANKSTEITAIRVDNTFLI